MVNADSSGISAGTRLTRIPSNEVRDKLASKVRASLLSINPTTSLMPSKSVVFTLVVRLTEVEDLAARFR